MKRSITLYGHRTSVSLEKEFWDGLHDIASARAMTPTEIIAEIDKVRQPEENLSSAIRIYVFTYFREQLK